MVYLFKKMIGFCLMPLSIVLVLTVTGTVLLWLKRWERCAKWLLTSGLVILFLAAYGIPGSWIMRHLESRHPPFPDSTPVSHVVVLGGGYTYSWYIPERNHIGTSSLARVVEGVRIYRLQKQPCKLILSGSAVGQGMRRVALDLGVPGEDIVLETKSADTKDQARILGEMLDGAPFALVTSASHMPRSMAMFRKQGLAPIAAPTFYRCKPGKHWMISRFVPKASRIATTERAEYECLGLLWAWLRGQL